MNTYVCTPRGFVVEVYPSTQWVGYYDTPTGEPHVEHNLYARSVERAEYIERAVHNMPMRKAPNIHIARVDFMFDQASKDTLEDIRRMFRNAMSDRKALARRALPRWQRHHPDVW